MIITIGKTKIAISPGLVQTALPSGRTVPAAPQHTEAYEAQAKKLGYKNGFEMNALHDLVHVLLASWLGMEVSPALDAASQGKSVTELTGAEEDVVLALQRYANLAGVDLIKVAALR